MAAAEGANVVLDAEREEGRTEASRHLDLPADAEQPLTWWHKPLCRCLDCDPFDQRGGWLR